jgi:hypothetical protein
MADDEIAGDTFAGWITPGEALDRLTEFFKNRDTAAEAIVERLRGGTIKSGAKSAAWEGRTSSRQTTWIIKIEPSYWLDLSVPVARAPIWQSSDVRLFVAKRFAKANVDILAVRYFGVRFDPSDIEKWILDLPVPKPLRKWRPAPKPAPPILIPTAEQPTAPKKKPLPENLLKPWYELYQRAYSGPEDTEQKAVDSANGMFPGKYVTRDQIRELRGARKPGRPTKKAP